MATPIPNNVAPFTVHQNAELCGGTLLHDGPPVVGVSTDSRRVAHGELFVALSGDRFDGHDLVGGAYEAGAACALVCSASSVPQSMPAVLVADTRAALGKLAHAHRVRWGRVLVAVTGSAGKTTTKTLVRALLEVPFPGQTHATVGNLNNEIGVPMTLLGLEASHRFAIIEMGTSGPGEIAHLAQIAQPDAAILTLVAAAHSERLGGIDAIAREKGDLLRALAADGIGIANGDDSASRAQLATCKASACLTFGERAGCDYQIVERTIVSPDMMNVAIERPCKGPASKRDVVVVACPILGDAGAYGLAGALAMADSVAGRGLTSSEISQALSTIRHGIRGRLVAKRLARDVIVIDDSYNANPASMRASISVAAQLASLEGRPLLLILGDMLELGAGSDDAHAAIVAAVGELPRVRLIGVGGAISRAMSRTLPLADGRWIATTSADEACARALPLIADRQVILVKGSRSIRTEKIVDALTSRLGGGE